MRRAYTLAMTCCCLLGLLACAPAAGPVAGAPFASESPWRHWQPGVAVDSADAPSDMLTQPAPQAPAAGAGPTAVILALHGFNDYSNAFEDFAAYARMRGVAVHAYDQRGFGANADRGHWPGTERLSAELRSAVARLRAIYGDVPLYVLGESMGGAVTIVTATGGEPLDVDGLILSAPAVWGGPHMNLFYRMTLWLTSTLAPGWTLTGSGLDIRPSDNIEMLRAFSADPLVIKATRTDAIAGLVALMDQALASAPALDRKTLLLIGEKDEIIPEGALDDFQSRLESADATVISYADGYHMLLRDLQRARVFEDILAWIGREPADVTASASADHSKP